jgi:hypothetical protein
MRANSKNKGGCDPSLSNSAMARPETRYKTSAVLRRLISPE